MRCVLAAGGYMEYDYGGISIEQIQALVNQSGYCSQKLSYECKKSGFLINKAAPSYAIIVDDDGNELNIWSGRCNITLNSIECKGLLNISLIIYMQF